MLTVSKPHTDPLVPVMGHFFPLLCRFPAESRNLECELPHLACSVYYSTLQDMPAMVRLWWNSQEKRVSTVVEKFTVKYISPVLSAQEISSVHSSTQMSDSMTVSSNSTGSLYFDATSCHQSTIIPSK